MRHFSDVKSCSYSHKLHRGKILVSQVSQWNLSLTAHSLRKNLGCVAFARPSGTSCQPQALKMFLFFFLFFCLWSREKKSFCIYYMGSLRFVVAFQSGENLQCDLGSGAEDLRLLFLLETVKAPGWRECRKKHHMRSIGNIHVIAAHEPHADINIQKSFNSADLTVYYYYYYYFSLPASQYHNLFLGNNERQQRGKVKPAFGSKQTWSRTEGKHGIVKQSVGLLVSHYCSIVSVWMSTISSHHLHHTRTARNTSTSRSTHVSGNGETESLTLKGFASPLNPGIFYRQ